MFTCKDLTTGLKLNFLETLKKCEPVVTQIAKDAGVSRQAVYLWSSGLPLKPVFDKLSAIGKYKAALSAISYDDARKDRPLGRPI